MGEPTEHPPRHVPVMLARCLELLGPALGAPGSLAVDATLGLGGHAAALLAAHPQARLLGLDRDPQALELARRRLAPYAERVELVHAVYDELPEILARLRLAAPGKQDEPGRDGSVQAVLFDLGVSSLQLDESGRGFAYAQDAPLDMRMDQTRGRTAADVVNGYPARELARVLRVYGEERFAARIAAAVVREREREPFTGTARLAELVRSSIPAATRRTGGHPAKRTFQALRIEVNAELEVLERAVPAAIAALAVGGRLVVLSYHSLEDRIVKRALAVEAASTAPHGLPVELPEHRARLALLTRGAEQASAEEVRDNPRSASVRLRAAERVLPGRGPALGREAR